MGVKSLGFGVLSALQPRHHDANTCANRCPAGVLTVQVHTTHMVVQQPVHVTGYFAADGPVTVGPNMVATITGAPCHVDSVMTFEKTQAQCNTVTVCPTRPDHRPDHLRWDQTVVSDVWVATRPVKAGVESTLDATSWTLLHSEQTSPVYGHKVVTTVPANEGYTTMREQHTTVREERTTMVRPGEEQTTIVRPGEEQTTIVRPWEPSMSVGTLRKPYTNSTDAQRPPPQTRPGTNSGTAWVPATGAATTWRPSVGTVMPRPTSGTGQWRPPTNATGTIRRGPPANSSTARIPPTSRYPTRPGTTRIPPPSSNATRVPPPATGDATVTVTYTSPTPTTIPAYEPPVTTPTYEPSPTSTPYEPPTTTYEPPPPPPPAPPACAPPRRRPRHHRPVHPHCAPPLPAECARIGHLDGPRAVALLPACDAALGPTLTARSLAAFDPRGPVAICFSNAYAAGPRMNGDHFAACLERGLARECALAQCPSECRAMGRPDVDGGRQTPFELGAGVRACVRALGPRAGEGAAAARCFRGEFVTDGPAALDCLLGSLEGLERRQQTPWEFADRDALDEDQFEYDERADAGFGDGYGYGGCSSSSSYWPTSSFEVYVTTSTISGPAQTVV